MKQQLGESSNSSQKKSWHSNTVDIVKSLLYPTLAATSIRAIGENAKALYNKRFGDQSDNILSPTEQVNNYQTPITVEHDCTVDEFLLEQGYKDSDHNKEILLHHYNPNSALWEDPSYFPQGTVIYVPVHELEKSDTTSLPIGPQDQQ